MNNLFFARTRGDLLACSTPGIWWAAWFALFLAFTAPAIAATDPWTVDEQQVAADIQQHPAPRQFVVVFDISGSMQDKVPESGYALTRWQEARAATSQLLSSTLQPGDSLTILPFDSVVHKPIALGTLNATKIAEIGQQIPDAMSGESGTNMRLAHDEALILLRAVRGISGMAQETGKHLPWRAIIVVSDGYNDSPPKGTPAWKDYAKFCNVHGDNQNLYPATPECTEWKGLAAQFEKSGKGKTYGLGVKIKDAVPEYRPPNEVSTLTAAGEDESASTIAGTVYNGDQPAAAARIEALDAQGNEVDAATSEPDGKFVLKGLTPGTYTVQASQGGSSGQLP
ncbi:MAG: carboxypeptidase regulatory-like domain-containing protein, partial [Armatimonadota bacterium]|nr:carboxypeptidase regulatory-like domain-containing protein [Armatimonadota bacterium]